MGRGGGNLGENLGENLRWEMGWGFGGYGVKGAELREGEGIEGLRGGGRVE